MLGALDDSQGGQRQLLADASNELRTPLTSLRANPAIFEPRRRAGRGRAAAHVRRPAHRDRGPRRSRRRPVGPRPRRTGGRRGEAVPLRSVVEETVDWAGRRAPGGALRRAPGVVLGSADRALAQRAVANLLDNAAKWTPPGGIVAVALDDDALNVQDDGPGIDPADLPRLFERFYRAPAARGLPGAGLGLAIVRKVADSHGWAATADGPRATAPASGCGLNPRRSRC